VPSASWLRVFADWRPVRSGMKGRTVAFGEVSLVSTARSASRRRTLCICGNGPSLHSGSNRPLLDGTCPSAMWSAGRDRAAAERCAQRVGNHAPDAAENVPPCCRTIAQSGTETLKMCAHGRAIVHMAVSAFQSVAGARHSSVRAQWHQCRALRPLRKADGQLFATATDMATRPFPQNSHDWQTVSRKHCRCALSLNDKVR
jgi:hypothetical protein